MTLTNVPSYEEKRLCDINQISRTEWAQLRLVYIPTWATLSMSTEGEPLPDLLSWGFVQIGTHMHLVTSHTHRFIT